MEVINKYETVFILNPELSEDDTKAMVTKFTDLIAQNGTIDNVNKWGMRKLAYPINFKTEGFYVLMNVELDPAEVDPMAKLMNITEGIVRQIFVRK